MSAVPPIAPKAVKNSGSKGLELPNGGEFAVFAGFKLFAGSRPKLLPV